MTADPINPEIQYVLLGGCSPVEATGTYRSATFDFRARYNHWDFILSLSEEYPACVLATLIDLDLDLVQASTQPLEPDLIVAFQAAFARSGEYGLPGDFAASYMPTEGAMTIVRSCIQEFRQQQARFE